MILTEIILEFNEGQAKIIDDRGGIGDILITWKPFIGSGKKHKWYVKDLVKKSNIVAPKKYHLKTGKAYLPLPKNVWKAIRKAIKIYE